MMPEQLLSSGYLRASSRGNTGVASVVRIYWAERARRRPPQVNCESSGLNSERSTDTAGLECRRGNWNSRCSGEMRRYREEHLRRRRVAGLTLTLIVRKLGER